jgi:hypothetical protein
MKNGLTHSRNIKRNLRFALKAKQRKRGYLMGESISGPRFIGDGV